MKDKIVPVIEEDGSFTETLYCGNTFLKAKQAKVKWWEKILDPLQSVYTESYMLEKFSFRASNTQQVKVAVYVADLFLSHLEKDVSRKEAIKEHIKKHSPWLFSYGEREVLDD